MAGKTEQQRIAETKAKLQARFGVTADKPAVDNMSAKAITVDREEYVAALDPRISLSLGVTLPMANYKSVRAEAGLTINRPLDLTTSQTFDWLEEVLMEKIASAIETLMESELVN